MSKPLIGTKIAILIANGFSEQDMTETQRALTEAGANVRIVSPEQGLVNGWTGDSWGHHFAVDAVLSTALGADYSMLFIPGGQRSHDKLKLTAHTRRFVNSFLAARKPVAVCNDALNVIIASEGAQGRSFHGPEALKNPVTAAGGNWSDDNPCIDGTVLSGVTGEDQAGFVRAVVSFFAEQATPALGQAA